MSFRCSAKWFSDTCIIHASILFSNSFPILSTVPCYSRSEWFLKCPFGGCLPCLTLPPLLSNSTSMLGKHPESMRRLQDPPSLAAPPRLLLSTLLHLASAFLIQPVRCYLVPCFIALSCVTVSVPSAKILSSNLPLARRFFRFHFLLGGPLWLTTSALGFVHGALWSFPIILTLPSYLSMSMSSLKGGTVSVCFHQYPHHRVLSILQGGSSVHRCWIIELNG